MWQLLIPAISSLLEKVLPDPQAQANAKLEMLKLAQSGDFKEIDTLLALAQGQMDINKVEAASAGLFRGGWRPAVGWVCVAGLIYQFLVQPLLPWFAAVVGFTVPPLPNIDNGTLMVLLTGMLGLGGMRTLEKLKGQA